MGLARSVALYLAYGWFFVAEYISDNTTDSSFGKCVHHCEMTGEHEYDTIRSCQLAQFLHTGMLVDRRAKLPGYILWKQLKCRSDCQYRCMIQGETIRKNLGKAPFEREMWPFKQVFFLQDPLSAGVSVYVFFVNFLGWLKFCIWVHGILPLRTRSQRTYYEYIDLVHAFAFLTINSWFWSCIFHIRPLFEKLDLDLLEKLDCFSAVTALVYSHFFCFLRIFNMTNKAERMLFSVPFLLILGKHIWDLCFYMDYERNKLLCLMMGTIQNIAWILWGRITRHPARFKLYAAVVGFSITMLMDFPVFLRYKFDNYYLPVFIYYTTIMFTRCWWSFIREDAVFRTAALTEGHLHQV